ncbi:MAG: hypothetical protein JW750_04115 [Anaerolineaceae bacterium]|nr:hypothetical protein [Anaerolineaceae bacterium]
MSIRERFTNDEWVFVSFAPAIAANGIAMVDGTIDESETLMISGMLLDARDQYTHNQLIVAAINSFKDLVRSGEIPGELRYIRTPEEYLRAFRKVGKIVDKKALAEEGREYKQFLVDIMSAVASASKRNASFFRREANVSSSEMNFIDHIKQILRL